MRLPASYVRWIRTTRVWLTLLFGGVSLGVALVLAVYIDRQQTESLTRANANTLVLTGRPIAAALAQGLKEREREVVLLSHHPLLTQGPLDSAAIQAQFEDIQQSLPFYSWLGVADTEAIVQSSLGGLLHHESVRERPWFAAGLKGPYSGDAHKALLLERLLKPAEGGEPLRFLDFSSPVRAPDGTLRGVVAAHLSWEWATSVIAQALEGLPDTGTLEVLILNSDGEFLHPRHVSQLPSGPLPGAGQSAWVTWGRDGAYLTTTLALPDSTVKNLGWTLVVRQPMQAALAPIRALHRVMALWAIGLIGLLMGLCYWAARYFSAPLEQLAAEALRLDATGQGVDFNIDANTVEFAHLRNALRRMTRHLLQSKLELEEANQVLEQKVLDRTAEIQMRELQYRSILEDQTEIICRFGRDHTLTYVNDAYCRVFNLRREEVLGQVWAPVVHPDDLGGVQQALARVTPEQPVTHIDNRVIDGTGDVRWFQFVNRAFYDADGSLREWQTVGRDVTQSKRLELEVHQVSEDFQDLYNHAPCGYYSVDRHGVIVRINDLALEWMGVTRDEVLNRARLVDFLDEAGQATYWSNFPAFLEQGVMGPIEFNLIGHRGITRRVSLAATAVRDAQGEFVASRSVMYDVSELFIMRYQLRQLNAELEAMLDNELVGIAKVKDRRIVWRNRALEQIFGYGPGELLGVSTEAMYVSAQDFERLGAESGPALQAGQRYRSQMPMRRKNGDPIWLDISGVQMADGTGETLWLLQDISEMKQYQAQVEHIAFHDPLTNLPNRLLMSDRLRQAMATNDRDGSCTALCYLDLDGFKPINDQHGHSAGDEVLRVVAQRLLDALRANDTVARLGGDEFALLLTHLGRPDEAELVMRRVLHSVSQPITLKQGNTVAVTTSLGVAYYPRDAKSAGALFTLADQAMYASKKQNQSRALDPGAAI